MLGRKLRTYWKQWKELAAKALDADGVKIAIER